MVAGSRVGSSRVMPCRVSSKQETLFLSPQTKKEHSKHPSLVMDTSRRFKTAVNRHLLTSLLSRGALLATGVSLLLLDLPAEAKNFKEAIREYVPLIEFSSAEYGVILP